MRWANSWGMGPPHSAAALADMKQEVRLRTFTIEINDGAAAALESSARDQRRSVEDEIAVLLEEITAGVAEQIEIESKLLQAIEARTAATPNNN